MSYIRVIPRDLFNEASLLKCFGQIFINLETAELRNVELAHDGAAFEVQQDNDSGSTSVSNVMLMVRGKPCRLYRPLNSREAWPLYLLEDNDEEIAVFDDEGSFSREMKEFLQDDRK
jgi:hypothetical protein